MKRTHPRSDRRSWSHFLFTGLAVFPLALAVAGHIDAALMLYTPLLIGACLSAAAERELTAPARVRTDE
jgi:hypothetical protein